MKIFASLIAMAALTAALGTFTFAANKNEAGFTLAEAARVGSTNLPPGDYKVQWTAEAGEAVKVEIMQRGKTVATAEGKLKDLQTPSPYTAVVTRALDDRDNDNAVAIDEIDFSNRSQALVLVGQ